LPIGLGVALYNLLILTGMRTALQPEGVVLPRTGNLIAHLQIGLDLVALTGVIHFTGGLESPLGPYLVFHMVIASTLLSAPAAAAQATLASALYGGLLLLEAHGILPHYSLGLFASDTYRSLWVYFLPLALISALYVSIYLAGTIVQKLRRHERELSALTQRLEDERERAEEARREVEAAQHMQLRYMYRVSHELRAPLSAAASLLNALTQGHAEGQPAERTAEVLRRVSTRLHQALDLVADLLTLSHAREAPREEQRSWVDIPTLLAQVVDRAADRAATAGIALKLAHAEEPVPIWAQREALETALANLVGNAIKYTEPGGEVTVTATQDAVGTHLAVRDTGIGIAPEDQARLFEEFFRAPAARARVAEGTGLGLSIVESLMQAQGGTCTIESRPGEGSTFTLHLPPRYRETEPAL
jgi:signal transduction histidine kinase